MAVEPLSSVVFERFKALSCPRGAVQVEYVWITPPESGQMVRSKSRTMASRPSDISEIPMWDFDGSSTLQAPRHDSEVMLHPVRMYSDPFRGGDNILVLCECRDSCGEPVVSNSRAAAQDVFERFAEHDAWYGIEQEYTLFEADGRTPFGWPRGGYPGPQGPYYCGVGTSAAYGRLIAEAHYSACLFAGVKIAGINAEDMPGQWEFQIGPCSGLQVSDDTWVARYILLRVCEAFGVNVSFDPKPVPGDWNGAGAHVNFSTRATRDPATGMKSIAALIEKLRRRHFDHIRAYGEGNERRLTGRHETEHIARFTHGVANRNASVRIPRVTERAGAGYIEDRRPGSNTDPYIATAIMLVTAVQQ